MLWTDIYKLVSLDPTKIKANQTLHQSALVLLKMYERDFLLSLSDNNQADIMEGFTPASIYIVDLLNIESLHKPKFCKIILPLSTILETITMVMYKILIIFIM